MWLLSKFLPSEEFFVQAQLRVAAKKATDSPNAQTTMSFPFLFPVMEDITQARLNATARETSDRRIAPAVERSCQWQAGTRNGKKT